TALSAGIRGRRQIPEERGIELTTGEARIELSGIDTDEARCEAIADESSRQLRGVHAPNRKNRIETTASEQSLPIRAHVFQKEISESNVSHFRPFLSDRLQRLVKRGLV